MTYPLPLSLEELELSLVLAEASALTYCINLNPSDVQKRTGISIVKYFDYNANSQWNITGFWGIYKNYLIVSFRGTNNIGDWKKNFKLLQNHEFCLEEGIDGIKTHYGFSQTVAGGWEDFLKDLNELLLQENPSKNNCKLLLTGHSLGGALAVLIAYRLSFLPQFSSKIQAIYTYGAPRVGNRKFKESCKVAHYRFNYGNDPVPALPSIRYEHHGQLYYLPASNPGVISKDSQNFQSYKALSNVIQGGIKLFLYKQKDGFSQIMELGENVADHNIEKYIEHIKSCQQFIEIVQGLQNGSLNRSGGTIRDKKTDRIVGHLFESQEITEQLFLLKESFLTPKTGQGIPMQMSQLPVGADVLNLGVSIIGFAYMARKLGQIQNDLNNIKGAIAEGFERIDDQLKILHGQLTYISLLVEDNAQEQRNLAESISELHRVLLVENMAILQSAILDRERFPDFSVRDALLVTAKTRIFMSDQALYSNPDLNAKTMLITDIAVKGWVAAISAEAHILLEIGKISDAEQVLNDEIPRFQNMVFKWADALLSHEEEKLSTPYRFATSLFEKYISPERIERITRISQASTSLTPEQIRRKKQDAQIELDLISSPYRNNQDWIRRQVAVAEYLDMFSELLARLKSLQAFALLCKSKNFKTSRELLPGIDAEPGLYILPVA